MSSSLLLLRLTHLRALRISPSTLPRSTSRALTTSSIRSDILNELEKQLHPRELIERKKKEFEEKYGHKLKQKIEAEGVQDLEELKKKVIAPSVRSQLKRKNQTQGRSRQFETSASASNIVAEAQNDEGKNYEEDHRLVDQEHLASVAEYETAPKHGLIPDPPLHEESEQLQHDRAGVDRAIEQIERDAREKQEANNNNEELPNVAEYETAPKDGLQSESQSQAEGDRSGIKPLSSIINLPLLHLTPHDAAAISQIWTAYHTTHPTLSSSFLSATVPAKTYKSMLQLARQNPFFVLPLPRLAEEPSAEEGATSQVKTDEHEMFFLQWLFHPTPTSSSPPSPELNPEPLPLTTSIIFTPLEEYKKSGEWAQPYLVLTHYPDLAQTHELVLMRGEISPAAASNGSAGSLANPGFLLSQQQAQLLALALQRFYCTGSEVPNEGERGRQERIKRAEALVGFRERPAEWDWKGLVEMAYGGLV
ncbi:hypothetical protein CI109_105876 [Kwoniella shandongensis]|uniref:Uncharacterized protein n=1 Tax=Kwoniella shandongensis TaxID=1734106 RepID=A0A5M6BVE2_9TREE|nr:uncharacterized protein CI109_005689 [Kwoniella shandongensis]KAA5525942.1 hypothetical protein CI109_005689 [Kwoniella shandongensis]